MAPPRRGWTVGAVEGVGVVAGVGVVGGVGAVGVVAGVGVVEAVRGAGGDWAVGAVSEGVLDRADPLDRLGRLDPPAQPKTTRVTAMATTMMTRARKIPYKSAWSLCEPAMLAVAFGPPVTVMTAPGVVVAGVGRGARVVAVAAGRAVATGAVAA